MLHKIKAFLGGIFRKLTWKRVLAGVGVVLLLAIVGASGFLWYISAKPAIPPYRPIAQYVYLNETPNACVDEAGEPALSGVPASAFDTHTRNPKSAYQGWCEEYRQNYYRRPQGTTFFGLRYDWVANLERPVGKKRIMTRDYMESIGFIYDGVSKPHVANPYDLPIGMTWHRDSASGDRILDFSCAACHSSQLTYQGKALQIDGGSGGHSLTSTAPSQFIVYSVASVFTTLINPFKFERFADALLADIAPEERRAKRKATRRAMWTTLGEAVTFAWYNRGKIYPTEEGYGRTDGLGRIVNTVFADYLDHSNYRVANAPVNYPHLWDIWGFNWVQWMGSVKQAMARNVNESLGVRARLDLKHADTRFESSAMLDEMHCIETTLQHLTPPSWPEDLFGAVDRDLARQGQGIFQQVCASCHGPFRVKGPDLGTNQPGVVAPNPMKIPCKTCHGPWGHNDSTALPTRASVSNADFATHPRYQNQTERSEYWKMLRIPISYVGTDSTSADNFINNTYDLSSLKDTPAGRAVSAMGEATDERYISDWEHVPGAVGLRFIGGEVRFDTYAKWGLWDRETRTPIDSNAVKDLDGWGALDRPIAMRAYRPRPLEGVWATAPFLHNGSVPSLYQLLLPAEERDAVFYVGRKEYDPASLGLVTTKFPNAFKYDTSITGNSNLGHEFDDGLCGDGVIGYEADPVNNPGFCRQFTEEERRAILEYMKVHSDAPRMDPGSAAHCSRATWPSQL